MSLGSGTHAPSCFRSYVSDVDYGVPHGYLLGPLLFTLCRTADATQLYLSMKPEETALSERLGFDVCQISVMETNLGSLCLVLNSSGRNHIISPEVPFLSISCWTVRISEPP